MRIIEDEYKTDYDYVHNVCSITKPQSTDRYFNSIVKFQYPDSILGNHSGMKSVSNNQS